MVWHTFEEVGSVMEKYEKVLALMQTKPNGVVSVRDLDLLHILGDRLAYRIPMYMSNIRRKANVKVRGIRKSRKVVGYQLVAMADPDAPIGFQHITDDPVFPEPDATDAPLTGLAIDPDDLPPVEARTPSPEPASDDLDDDSDDSDGWSI
jgi:hypothetical protein